MLCSLSSSCLSEIWGGGCGGTEQTINQRGFRSESALWQKCVTARQQRFSPRRPPQGRTKCGCTGDLGPLLQRCDIQDQWPASWTAGRAPDSLLWQRGETEREAVGSDTKGKCWGRYKRGENFPICGLRKDPWNDYQTRSDTLKVWYQNCAADKHGRDESESEEVLLLTLSCSESEGKAQSGKRSAKLTPEYCGLFIT